MTDRDFSALLDIPAFPAAGYAKIADSLASILNTKNDILLIQGEAIVALEAVAASLARPKLRALNIVTSPYGTWFGTWLKRGGANVLDIHAPAGQAINIDTVKQALETAQEPFDVLALVHAESASGVVNPLEEIAALAKQHGLLTVVDAVASVGGHRLQVDDNALDIVVIGPQKALSGPAGVSAISVSKQAWDFFDHVAAPRLSILSIMDQKEQWLDTGKGTLPGTVSPLEFYALEAALQRIEEEGIQQMLARHDRTSTRMRRALEQAGIKLWAGDTETSKLVTSFIVPEGISRNDLLNSAFKHSGHTMGEAVGPGTDHLIRINHTGQNASDETVQRNIDVLAELSKSLGFAFNSDAASSALKE